MVINIHSRLEIGVSIEPVRGAKTLRMMIGNASGPRITMSL